jgi:hypothetical protein
MSKSLTFYQRLGPGKKYVLRLLCAATSLVLLPACSGGHPADDHRSGPQASSGVAPVPVGPTAPSGSFPTAVRTTIRPADTARQVLVTERQQGSTIEVSVGTVLVVRLSKISGVGWGPARVAPSTVLSLNDASHVLGGPLDATVETKAPGTGYVSANLYCSGRCKTWGVTVVVRG